MGPLRWLAHFRPRGAGGLFLLVGLFFFLVGGALLLLGFDLAEADAWLERHGGWFDAAGSLLFKGVCGLVLLLCLFSLGGALLDRKNPERPGWGCALLALVVGYFAWFGMISD
jgi:hypothetical protein